MPIAAGTMGLKDRVDVMESDCEAAWVGSVRDVVDETLVLDEVVCEIVLDSVSLVAVISAEMDIG